MYRERADRDMSRRAPTLSDSERAERERASRWKAPGKARVVHPAHGAVVVPCGSKLSALECAAEVWGCSWAEIRTAEVWLAATEETPVPMPIHIK